ncbi:DUF1674 domain-containing protein [Rothia mucilaginosa]
MCRLAAFNGPEPARYEDWEGSGLCRVRSFLL